jgi:hypothetical protein
MTAPVSEAVDKPADIEDKDFDRYCDIRGDHLVHLPLNY